MKIALDIQSCQSGSRHGGIGRYSSDLAKAMISYASDCEFILLLNNLHPDITEEIKADFQSYVQPNNIKTFFSPTNIAYIKSNHLIRKQAESIRLNFIESLGVDALHVTSLFEGLHDEVVVSVSEHHKRNYATAVTVYDLIPHEQREAYLRDQRARSHYYDKFNQLNYIDCALAISKFSSQEFSANFPEFRGTIANISGGFDKKFKPIESAYFKSNAVFSRNNICKEYILYTASFDQRKNHTGLIRAFSALDENIRDKYVIVFVGNGWQNIYEHLWNFASSLGLDRSKIIFTGRVDDEELVALYNCCKLFVFPSFWEGLGMPPVEAMACGAAVIGSNTTSIAEVIGLNEAMFDPNMQAEFNYVLQKALTDTDFMKRLENHSLLHPLNFNWEKSAEIALNAIRQSVDVRKLVNKSSTITSISGFNEFAPLLRSEQRVLNDCSILSSIESSYNKLNTNHKIAWVSSYRTKCGIASYSNRLITNMESDIKVFAPILNESESETEYGNDSHIEVMRCWKPGKNDSLYDLSEYIDEYHPQVIIIQFNFGFFDLPALAKFIQYQTNKKRTIYIFMHSTLDQSPLSEQRLSYIANQLSAATAIFVHTINDIRRLAELGLKNDVICVPQGVINFETDFSVSVYADPFVIASYGFFLPGKGLRELVESIKILLAQNYSVRLLMINAHYQDRGNVSENEIQSVNKAINDLGLSDHVDINIDYLDEQESILQLRSANLIVLPYQKTGESSSAAVRTSLSSGVPVAVTPNKIFDDVSEFVFKLPGISPLDIATGIAQYIEQSKANLCFDRERIASARRWCLRNDVLQTAGYISKSMHLAQTRQLWNPVFDSTIENISVNQGIVRGENIECNMKVGVIVYGPYISLSSGSYVLNASISSILDDEVAGSIILSYSGGKSKILELPIRANGLYSDISVNFLINKDISDFECVFIGNGSYFVLEGYSIKRKHYIDLATWSQPEPKTLESKFVKASSKLYDLNTINSLLKDKDNHSEFVTVLYQQILGRDPDDEGLNNWLSKLSQGYISRGEVIDRFLGSREYYQNRNK